ncbi:hypothetical protein KBD08_00155 [Candidatus Babeliales bacterium]|nr:hypothetical protein [Candidatus Babeliales bacterium]
MNAQVALFTPKQIFSIIVFFAVCLMSCWSEAEAAKYVAMQKMPHDTVRLELATIENDTQHCEFQLFAGSDTPCAYVFPKTVFTFPDTKLIAVGSQQILVIKSTKGSFLPVYIQHGGLASGQVKPNYEGPYYISMWLEYPYVPETSKVHVRYMLKKDTVGKVGIKIGSEGDYRFVAHDNVEFIV